ncbi:MAG: methyltransferase [Myxococcota bacterium]
MSIPANPQAMHGWFGYRHIPYQPGERGYALAREIVELKLPKKEFFEITHMVETVRDGIDPWRPVFDCCSGHGLLGMLLACDERLPKAVVLDQAFPPNRARLFQALAGYEASLVDRLEFVERKLQDYRGFGPGAFVAAHACGFATDYILEAALRNRARFFIMTCCITRAVARSYGLSSVHGLEQQINDLRLAKAMAAGYTVEKREIDGRITPWNTILVGWPDEEERSPRGGLRPGLLPARLPPKLAREEG